jgi:hypothetical protein
MVATFIAPDLPGTGQPSGIRAFIPAIDTSSVAVWAMESQLAPPNVGFEAPVGVSVAQPGGGRLVLISMPLRIGQPAPAGRMLRRMLYGYTSGTNATPGLIRLR